MAHLKRYHWYKNRSPCNNLLDTSLTRTFNVKKLNILRENSTHTCRLIFKTSSDYFLLQHELNGLYYWFAACLLWGGK